MDKTVPAGAARLLDLIGSIEAPKGYDTVYGNRQGSMPKSLTTMTVDEVIADGRRRTKAYGSSAAGRYQFMTATLKGLKSELRLRGEQIFSADLQDRLGYHLLRRRGYDQFMAGKLPIVVFGLAIAKEWASFPVLTACQGAHRKLKAGQSYYAGDGVNKCLISPARVEAALLACRAGAPESVPTGIVPDPSPNAAPPPPKPEAVSLWDQLKSIFRKA